MKIQSGANQIADLNKSLEHLEKIKQGLVADLEFERTANATALALESTLKMVKDRVIFLRVIIQIHRLYPRKFK